MTPKNKNEDFVPKKAFAPYFIWFLAFFNLVSCV